MNLNHAFIELYLSSRFPTFLGGSSWGVVDNVLDCNIIIQEFNLQSHYYAHFWTNTFGKGMNSLIFPPMDYIVPLMLLVGRVFDNGPGDLGSIPSCVIPKTLKKVLDISLLNTQQYKVCIKSKVEQSRERSSTLPYTSV